MVCYGMRYYAMLGAMGLPTPSLPFARDILREAVPAARSCVEARVPPPLCDDAPGGGAPGVLATSLSELVGRVHRWLRWR